MLFNGIYDNTINVPKKSVMDDSQPQYLKTLEKESGKSGNEVKVELDEQERIANDKVMQEPPSMNDDEDINSKIKNMGYEQLLDIYKNGEHEGDTDEITYEDLVAQNPETPGFGDPNINLFTPQEQPLYQQVQDDINKINAENPTEPEEDIAPLGMDELGEIAEGDGSDVEMPNDSEPTGAPPTDSEPEPIEGFDF